jgi:hypothetical protein
MNYEPGQQTFSTELLRKRTGKVRGVHIGLQQVTHVSPPHFFTMEDREKLEELKAQLEGLGQGHVFAQLADELQDIAHPVAQQLLRLNVAGWYLPGAKARLHTCVCVIGC